MQALYGTKECPMGKNRKNRWIAFVMCVTLTISLLTPTMVAYAAGNDQTGNTDIVRDVSLSYQLKGTSTWTPMSAPYDIADITKIQKFHALYSFSLLDNVDPQTGLPNRTVHEGDYYLIDLPASIQISNPSNGSINGNNDRVIAQYAFTQELDGTWQIQVTFTNYIDDPNEYEIFGSMEFDFTIDLSGVSDGETKTISIPIDNENTIELEYTKPVPPPTTPISMVKTVTSYSHSSRSLVWNVKMMPDTGVFSGCTFRDTIDTSRMTLTSIKHGSVTLVQGTDYTYDSTSGEIVYLIPNGRNGVNYQNIVITTSVKRSVYGLLTPTIIGNQARLTGGAAFVDLVSNTATQTVSPNWLGKTGTLYQGNKIQWTLEANITTQFMYNAVVTDYLQADVSLDKTTLRVGGTAVTVYDDTHTPASNTEIYGVYKANPDGTAVLEVYLPRGSVNASTTKRVITFVTSVTTPDTVVTADPVYNNTAKLEANYITDGGGEGTVPTVNLNQIGVAVPYVSVVKGYLPLTAADKRNGTINWTITAASNLTSYGGSKIVDTLPADQAFLPDEIYWGGTKIDGTTEPKAEISSDGRKLTITFATTDNALRTVQTFYVKTKIDPQVYGQNVNRNFSNQATATIYDKDTGLALDTSTSTRNVLITNNVITKASSVYNGNTTQNGQNPRLNYTITINENLMPLSDVIVSDDLSKIATEFKKSGASTYTSISGVKWRYVPGSMVITKDNGTLDNLDLSDIAAGAAYANDLLSIDFGAGTQVNDKYKITFTIEMDVTQNAIFEQNGLIRVKGNIGDISATGLKTGTVSTPATGNSADIKNEVLGKYGTHSVAEQQIVWTINLNQHNLGLANGRVVDILPAGLTLDPTSLRLYENVIGTDGNFVTGSAILSQGTSVPVAYTYQLSTDPATPGRFVLTVTLPEDDKAYILRFATDVHASLLGTQITNSAYYVGETLPADNTNTSIMTLSGTSGGGSTTKSSVVVYKNSKDDGTQLSGAVFALYWLRGGDPNDAVFVRNQTTVSGVATFFGLTRGEQYTISEVTPPNGYLLDDPDPVVFAVPSDGTSNPNPIVFADTPIKTGSFTPEAIKSLDGKSIVRDFKFAVKENDQVVLEGITKDTLQGGDKSVAFELAEGVDSAGLLHFTDSFTFDEEDPAGTTHLVESHTYTMEELDAKYPGYGFDDTVYRFVVKVYNVKGLEDLKVVIEDEQGTVLSTDDGKFLDDSIPVFYNTYRAGGELVLEGTKELYGHTLAAGQFSFQLYEGDTLLQTVQNEIGTNQSDSLDTGAFSFEKMMYTQEDVGTKTYRIIEKDEGKPGYKYDDSVYEVTVNVQDQDDGTINAEIAGIERINGQTTVTVDAIVFKNTYTTAELNVSFEGTKTLAAKTLVDGAFTFILTQTDSEKTPLKEIETVTNTNGQILFAPLTFTQEDRGVTFYYQVTEEDAQLPGITCDPSVYSIRLKIVDNEDGTLGADITYYVDGVETEGISFSNVYSAKKTFAVAATKILKGKKLTKDAFGFVWQQVDPITGAAISDKVIVRNASTGAIFFPAISFTEADDGKDFAYQVYEQKEKVRGMTYDPTKYLVSVHVTDLGDGTLGLEQVISMKSAGQTEYSATDAIVFSNSYLTPAEGFPNDEENANTGDGGNSNDPWLGFLALFGLLGAVLSLTGKQKSIRS